MGKGRQNCWIKKTKKTECPSNILVFDTESWHGDRALVPGGEWHTLRLGCALAYRLEDGKRTRVQELTFTDHDTFWRFVESRQSAKNPLWVFAHNLPYDMGITDCWRRIMDGKYEASKFALTSTLSFILGRYDGVPLNFCDTVNYYKCPLEEIGKTVGLPKMQMPDQAEPDSVWQRYCENDVAVTAKGLDSLISFVHDNQLGPWGPSIASLAMNAFTCRFMPVKSIAVHTNKEALRLERGAYFGGLTECNYIGRVSGPIHELDVISMYPAMCNRSVPVSLMEPPITLSVGALADYGSGYLLIADVTLSGEGGRYPVRGKTGTVYPRGTYRTCLADPELMEALANGQIQRVHSVARYHSRPILADYMKWFGDKKVEYNDVGNKAYRTLTKYYLNSLYGKFGQRTPRYMPWGEESLRMLEDQNGLEPGALEYTYNIPPLYCDIEDTHRFAEQNLTIDMRDLFGIVEVKVGYGEARYSMPAIAAHITSSARVFMRMCQRIAGDRHWFYTDTDSLWVDDIGLARLCEAGIIGSGRVGALEYKATHEWIHIFGPKDYELPTAVKIKGVKMSKSDRTYYNDVAVKVVQGDKTYYLHRTQDGEYRQYQFPSAITQIRSGLVGGVMVKHMTKRLHRRQTRWHVEQTGWTRPLTYPQESEGSVNTRA